MLNLRTLCASALFVAASAPHSQTAITADPAPDKSNPASIASFQIPSHGSGLNALMYIAAGAAPHPVVILFHGFPGNEKNLDLAQAIRRTGWDVLYFNYRGSWGTPGDFSFTHCMEDAQVAIAYVRDPANAKKLRADPSRIVLIGHSMGGMVAAYTAAHDPQIRSLVLISSANMAERAVLPESIPADIRKKAVAGVAAGLAAEGMAPLAGCTPESLAAELILHAPEWLLTADAPSLATRPVLIVTSDDGGAPIGDAFFAALKSSGNHAATEIHIATDHVYSDKRIALEETVLTGLKQQL